MGVKCQRCIEHYGEFINHLARALKLVFEKSSDWSQYKVYTVGIEAHSKALRREGCISEGTFREFQEHVRTIREGIEERNLDKVEEGLDELFVRRGRIVWEVSKLCQREGE